MNASKLFAAVAAFAVAGSAFAADVAGANVSATAASVVVVSAAQSSYAVRNLNVPVLLSTSNGPSRAQVHAEAVEAVKHARATFASQYDLLK
ncbi:hypothetical protein [Massilia sp. CF038]|uniref:hypothetical protein n=1 Tax=Massilia sp. CF038 TaxID=1881045 RepID=UPI00091CA44B|nr:hypothetical protein [Massilia sp. CF038]SHH04922.1 hypothetical protein SAMN05428948_2507 [Massilia sp. CF038]